MKEANEAKEIDLAVALHGQALQLLEERRLEEARACCERSLRILNPAA